MKEDSLPWGNRHPVLFLLIGVPILALLALLALVIKPFESLFPANPAVRSPSEVAGIIESFMDGSCGDRDWDDFICGGPIENAELEAIRLRCGSLPEEFPPTDAGNYCAAEGLEVLRGFAALLRAMPD